MAGATIPTVRTGAFLFFFFFLAFLVNEIGGCYGRDILRAVQVSSPHTVPTDPQNELEGRGRKRSAGTWSLGSNMGRLNCDESEGDIGTALTSWRLKIGPLVF